MCAVRVDEALTAADLAQHATAWDSLALAAPERLPMLSHAWVASFLESNVQSSQDWRCFFAYAEDRLIGVLPVMRIHPARPGVRFTGTFGMQAHTRSGHPLVRAGSEHEALPALLSALRAVEPHCVWLRFGGIRSGSPMLAVGRSGTDRVRTISPAAWKREGSILPVLGSFDDYERGLPANFRRNLRKARNRCERDHGLAWRFCRAADARRPDLLHRFLDLEASGWKGATGTAIRCVPQLRGFYSTLSERLGERNWLEWHFLELDGTPIAGHLAVRFGRSLVLLKIAYDERYARLGPGNLLFREVVARAFADDELDEINCVSNMPWHRNWCMSTAHYSDMLITSRRPLPVLAGLVEVEGPAWARRTVARARRPDAVHGAELGGTVGPAGS